MFAQFGGYFRDQGFLAMSGQLMSDALIVPEPKQRNTRADNGSITAAGIPKNWIEKHGKSHFDCRGHACANHKRELISPYDVTGATLLDGRVVEAVLDDTSADSDVLADRGHRWAATEQKPADRAAGAAPTATPIATDACARLRSGAPGLSHRSARRLSTIFGANTNDMGGTLMRSIGLARANARSHLTNIAYTMKRGVGSCWACPAGTTACPAPA